MIGFVAGRLAARTRLFLRLAFAAGAGVSLSPTFVPLLYPWGLAFPEGCGFAGAVHRARFSQVRCINLVCVGVQRLPHTHLTR